MKRRNLLLISLVWGAGVGVVCQAGEPGSETPAAACGAVVKGACAAGVLPAPAVSAHPYGVVDTRGLQALVQAKVPLVLLDARSGKWDDGRRLPGAKALAPDATAEAAALLIPTKDTLVVVYCSNLKCPASAMLAGQLAGFGYTNLLKYPEGIDGWAAAGNPVEAPTK